MGWRTHGEDWVGKGYPRRGPGWVKGPSGKSETGR